MDHSITGRIHALNIAFACTPLHVLRPQGLAACTHVSSYAELHAALHDAKCSFVTSNSRHTPFGIVACAASPSKLTLPLPQPAGDSAPLPGQASSLALVSGAVALELSLLPGGFFTGVEGPIGVEEMPTEPVKLPFETEGVPTGNER